MLELIKDSEDVTSSIIDEFLKKPSKFQVCMKLKKMLIMNIGLETEMIIENLA
jgi:hypothetical protein